MIVDFPDPDGNLVRLRFGRPSAIITATTVSGVRPALRAAAAASRKGGWVAGFVGYEAAPAFDAALVTRPHEGPAPLAWFGVFDEPAVDGPPSGAPARLPGDWQPDISRAAYDAAIADIRNAIAAGDVYQVNHTLRFHTHCEVDPAALHDALVAARHGVYHALIETDDWAIVSASPELFIDVRGDAITTRPMKGTMPRGRWLEEDLAAARDLAHAAKDRAENLMIVDLLRNDIGRVARFGTVEVRDMFDVSTYPTVHQMTSTVSARLRDDVELEDIFAAMFPCGSVTGAPKIAAMQRIRALERSPRGPYCGAIGVLRPDGSATFNVAIRTVVIDRIARTATYGSGGGITWDSSADAEYDEAVAKAALLAGSVPEFELIETMRLENGSIPRLDRHIARLAASAQYFGFICDHRVREALAQECAGAPTGRWRLRLTLARSGNVNVARVPLDEPHGEAARNFALADQPIDSRDRLRYHKTTLRAALDALRVAHPEAFDVLMFNERGCITEFTNGNVICEIDGVLCTPPREAGLLAGTFRAQLLDDGVVVERDIPVDELARATRVWLVNSVREWVPVKPQGVTTPALSATVQP